MLQFRQTFVLLNRLNLLSSRPSVFPCLDFLLKFCLQTLQNFIIPNIVFVHLTRTDIDFVVSTAEETSLSTTTTQFFCFLITRKFWLPTTNYYFTSPVPQSNWISIQNFLNWKLNYCDLLYSNRDTLFFETSFFSDHPFHTHFTLNLDFQIVMIPLFLIITNTLLVFKSK